jgi:ATP-dependent Clp protease ATP-binding subunit ClpA
MGRKKSPKVVEKSNGEFRVLPDEILEILVVLLDLCGLYPPASQDSSSGRLNLISSLDTLNKTLARKVLIETYSRDEEEVSTWLLSLEAIITSIRQESDAFLQSLDDDRVEVVLLCQELEVASRAQTDLLPICYFIKSLAAIYRMHLQVEEKMIADLRRLFDSFYSDGLGSKDSTNDMEVSLEQIQRIMQFLSRKELFQQPVFQEGVSIASRRQRANRPLDVVEALNTTCKSEQLANQISAQPCQRSSHITEAATIYDALHRFLNAGMQDLEAPVSFLLLVGNEGCGKTHVCDEIERRVETESLGIGRLSWELSTRISLYGLTHTLVSVTSAPADRYLG